MSRFKTFWFVIVLICLPGASYAQSTFASITGTITDASGAVVPNVSIVVTNVGTSIQFSATSNANGIYTVAQLLPGTYSLRAQASGFEEFLVSDIVLNSRDNREIDVALRVGKASTQVTVTGGATLINTESAHINSTTTEDQFNQLPMDAGAIWSFLMLNPGVTDEAGDLRVSGSRGGQDNWSMDGTTWSDGVDNSAMGPLGNYIEPFESMQIDLANNSAEFGALAQVTLISKSGTNQLHGDVFDRYLTPLFFARSPFQSSVASYVDHFVGGSLGGPIYIPKLYDGRNKTFFFVSEQSYRGSHSATSFNDTVPTAAMQQGNFSGFLPVQIYDPTTGQPFQGNQIPPDRINSVSNTLQTIFYPMPNTGTTSVFQPQNYRENVSYAHYVSYMWNIRLDEKITTKDSFYARVTWQHNPGQVSSALPTIGFEIETRHDDADAVSYTHIFTPHLLNEFRFGYGFNNLPYHLQTNPGVLNGVAFTNSLGLQGLAPGLPTNVTGLPVISFSGIGITPIQQSVPYVNPGYLNRTYQVQDNVSWFHGRHDMKFGFEGGHVDYNNYGAPSNLFGSMTFAPTFTSGGISGQGNPYADFLLGIPASSSISYPPIEQLAYRWYYRFFALDDFKITPKLTVNIGLRYELAPYWSEHNDHIALFDTANGKIVVPDKGLSTVSPFMPTSYVQTVGASSVGLPQTLMYTDTDNFAPRIGLAYRPWGTRTVFRAGFGIFYNETPYPGYSFGSTVPFIVSLPAVHEPGFGAYCRPASGFSG